MSNATFHIPQGTATGTGVGTIRRFLNSVGAIVITVGFVGVLSLQEADERNDMVRLDEADEADETITPDLALSAMTET